MSENIERICTNKECRIKFMARVADVSRGWARFCSKRCKARVQTRKERKSLYLSHNWNGYS